LQEVHLTDFSTAPATHLFRKRGNSTSPESVDPLPPLGAFCVGMTLQQEVRHKSEDVDDTVLLDVVRALGRRVKVVSREYDIPYIAGYNTDGHTVLCQNHFAG
jgi:hypothetical protein